VTPAGIGRDDFWKGILEPVSRVRPYGKLGDQYGPLVAAHMDTFRVGSYVDPSLLPKGAARHTQFAVAGAMLAIQDAGVSLEEFRRVHASIFVGTALMDFGSINHSIESVSKHGAHGTLPRTIYSISTAGIPGAINRVLGTAARTMVMQSSCCSGLDAIGYAARMVAEGEAEIALCGGTEAPLHRFPLLEIRAAGLTPETDAMPERLDRPFDLWRTTGVVSEGACMIVLEPESSPRKGYSFISGYAFGNDEPDKLCSGLIPANRLALAEAGIRPYEVDSINAWGPGHRAIDAAEASALIAVFQSALPDIPAVSIKGSIGNPLGGAPAIQVAAAALAQRHGIIPPTVNWLYPDPACPLNLSASSRALEHSLTLINAHGLAGVNSSLILEKC